ncbi:endonuclease/exonuclease/phosphatase family protein [Crenothrix sp.]|uniref:endonuclease/exonuclease/phosphatase family protein n=1 Tax=Crenothrix sp. TaxID=3100433 RepID=UPI00374D7CDD
MINLLFWNINRKDLTDEIKTLCDYYDVDVLVLAENKLRDVDIQVKLNKGGRVFVSPFNPSTRISFFTRYPERFLELVHDDHWGSIRKLTHPIGIEILLVAVHMPSKLHCSDQDQALIAIRIAEEIHKRELEQGHTRTIVMGDFNMNPFEAGLVSADGFHAIMDRNITSKGHRVVFGKEKKFFYNPMWSRLGDASEGSSGTYYYDSSKMTNYFWNTFDQALIRPSLLSCFDNNNLKVIDKIGDVSLLKNGKISKQFSDHLPLLVTLKVSQLNLENVS